LQPQRPSDFSRDDLCHQCQWTLPSAPKLKNIKAKIVRLDQSRERAALPERRHVAGGLNGPQHSNQCSGWQDCSNNVTTW
jgi:hypothetical protein